MRRKNSAASGGRVGMGFCSLERTRERGLAPYRRMPNRHRALFVLLLVKKKLVTLCERNLAASAEAEWHSHPPVLEVLFFSHPPNPFGGRREGQFPVGNVIEVAISGYWPLHHVTSRWRHIWRQPAWRHQGPMAPMTPRWRQRGRPPRTLPPQTRLHLWRGEPAVRGFHPQEPLQV